RRRVTNIATSSEVKESVEVRGRRPDASGEYPRQFLVDLTVIVCMELTKAIPVQQVKISVLPRRDQQVVNVMIGVDEVGQHQRATGPEVDIVIRRASLVERGEVVGNRKSIC